MALPMAPRPMMPRRSPHTLSVSGTGALSQPPARTYVSLNTVRRTVARISAHAASATHSAAAPGELVTAMPSSRALAMSTPS